MAALLLVISLGGLMYAFRDHVAFFNPAGLIALQQRNLFIFAILLMLLVVVPVFFMLFAFAWRFRETNTRAVYRPDWDGSRKLEIIWWGVPIVIIAILGSITWVTSHTLDPSRPIASNKPAMKVEVVALRWKWLFIYPESNIAAVNELHLPVGRPVEFVITSDGPMNSFWIPKLGGQIYAMAGMTSRLNLIADQPGIYSGSSANISGEGFADMKFSVVAQPDVEFSAWLSSLGDNKLSSLSVSSYRQLAAPGVADKPLFYSPVDQGIFDYVISSSVKQPGHPAETVAPAMERM